MTRSDEQLCPRPAPPSTGFTASRGAFSRNLRWAVLLVGLFFAAARPGWGYSLLTHEEIVDILWKDQIQPLLLARYPTATEQQLRQAHAYAYGGCVIQDIGYYPFGNKFFSDVAHYVRTGDFVANLIRESADIDEYAFALGALAHYSSDNTGHPLINRAVALTFPRLRAKYGEAVTYEDNPRAHIQTEFGFDITQVAKNRYTTDQYHDFIGFEVSKAVLERAFFRTYGLRLEEVLGNVDLAIGTFRRAVSQVIPKMTHAALVAYHPEVVRETPNFSKEQFLYNLSRAQYEAEWGKDYRKPGFMTRVLAFFVRWVPKIGVFKALAFKLPTPQTEDLYFKSVNRTVEDCRTLLREVGNGDLQVLNKNIDTGRDAHWGEYPLSDKTYARLLETLIKRGQEGVQPDLRAHILAFYAGADPPTIKGKEAKAWQRTTEELQALKAGPNSVAAAEIQKRLLARPFKLQSPKEKAG